MPDLTHTRKVFQPSRLIRPREGAPLEDRRVAVIGRASGQLRLSRIDRFSTPGLAGVGGRRRVGSGRGSVVARGVIGTRRWWRATVWAVQAMVQDLAAQLRRLVQLPDVAPEDRDRFTELLAELEAKSSQPDADAAAVRSGWDRIKTVLEAPGPSLNWVLTKMVLPGVLG